MTIEKIQILGAVLELPPKQHHQFSIFEVNGLDWQYYLAGSSKTAPIDLNIFNLGEKSFHFANSYIKISQFLIVKFAFYQRAEFDTGSTIVTYSSSSVYKLIRTNLHISLVT